MKPQIYILKAEDNNKKEISKKAYRFICDKAPYKSEIVKNENGKPYLKDCSDFYFNISHCKNIIAIAFCDKEVGIDIELVRDVNLKIADRFFAKDEKAFVKDATGFFYVWTRKEAFLKKTGEGLKRELSSFSVLENKNIKTFCEKDYILSVCSDTAEDFILIFEENF